MLPLSHSCRCSAHSTRRACKARVTHATSVAETCRVLLSIKSVSLILLSVWHYFAINYTVLHHDHAEESHSHHCWRNVHSAPSYVPVVCSLCILGRKDGVNLGSIQELIWPCGLVTPSE